jgi:hypothetical protein
MRFLFPQEEGDVAYCQRPAPIMTKNVRQRDAEYDVTVRSREATKRASEAHTRT